MIATASKPVPVNIVVYAAVCLAMKQRTKITLVRYNGTKATGIVNGIKPEDGSGKSWIVTLLLTTGVYEDIWVRSAV